MSTLDFTSDRYLALLLVNNGKICRIDGTLRHVENRSIDLGVYAALLVLAKEGYVLGQPGRRLDECQAIRLSVSGSSLLTQFHRQLANSAGREVPCHRRSAVEVR